MNILQAFILSIIEGLTEFLPISSTGHLILVSHLFSVIQSEFTKSFEILIQIGAIAAVIHEYAHFIIGRPQLLKKLAIGFLPSGIAGLLLYTFIKRYLLDNFIVVIIALIIGGIMLIIVDKLTQKKILKKHIEDLTNKEILYVGIFQSVSIIPGISRAAASIVGGLLVGLTRQEAVKFSFLLAIPTIAAASLLDLVKSSHEFTTDQILLLIFGLFISYITARLTIRWFLRMSNTTNLTTFGIYRIGVAILATIALLGLR